MTSDLVSRRVAALGESADHARLAVLLRDIVAEPALHARMVNTLARLEYVGVRKMLKSRRAEQLDLDGLQHMLDETVHALRLKKAAHALAGAAVRTFADNDTLAGDDGERYFQALDRFAEARLQSVDLSEGARAEANYLLTSAAIEVRAQVFYPLYDGILKAAGAPFSVAAIMRDEDRHLAEMTQQLAAILPRWREHLDAVLDEEAQLFARFVASIAAVVDRRQPQHAAAV